MTIGVARGDAWGAGAPPQGDEKNFSRHFCLNEAKTGLNSVRCTPGSLWQYNVRHIIMQKRVITKKRSSDFGRRKCVPAEKMLATSMYMTTSSLISIAVTSTGAVFDHCLLDVRKQAEEENVQSHQHYTDQFVWPLEDGKRGTRDVGPWPWPWP